MAKRLPLKRAKKRFGESSPENKGAGPGIMPLGSPA